MGNSGACRLLSQRQRLPGRMAGARGGPVAAAGPVDLTLAHVRRTRRSRSRRGLATARGDRCLAAIAASHCPHRADRHQLSAAAAVPVDAAACRAGARARGLGAGRAHRVGARCGPRRNTRASSSSRPRRSRTSCRCCSEPERLVLDIDGRRRVDASSLRVAGARAAVGPVHRRRSASARGPRAAARRARSQSRGEAGRVRAAAGRRIRPSAGARPVSAGAARSADGAPRKRARRRRRQHRRGAAAPDRRRASARSRAAASAGSPRGARSRSRSIRVMAARIRARSAAAARTRRTSCSRSRSKLKARIDGEPQHARDADARRRLLRAAARARAEGAPRAGRPLHLDPRRRVPRAARARLVGVRAVGERRHQRRGALARAEGEPART